MPSQHSLPHITGHHYPDHFGYLDEIDNLDQIDGPEVDDLDQVDDLDVDGCGDRSDGQDQHGEKH